MRALLVHPGPEHSVTDVFNGWAWGLRKCGVETAAYALHDRLAFYASHPKVDGDDRPTIEHLAAQGLRATCYDWWPDVVFVFAGFHVPHATMDILRSRRHTVVLVCTESPYEEQRQLAMAEHADVVVLNDPTNIGDYAAVCAHTWYVPHAYHPEVHRPPGPFTTQDVDVFFNGTGFPSRMLFFREYLPLMAEADVCLSGPWWYLSEDQPDDKPLYEALVNPVKESLPNDQVAGWYRRSRTGLNMYRQEAENIDQCSGWAIGPREVEMAACGLWHCTEWREENRQLLPMLPAFTTVEEAAEQSRWALDHPDETATAATAARAAVTDRRFDRHAADLLGRLP